MGNDGSFLQEQPNIALIQVPTNWDDLRKKHAETLYPFSLLYLASYLKKNKIRSQVIDCLAAEFSLKDLGIHIKKLNPDIIGFTSTTINRFNTLDATRYIRKIVPNTKIILGGRHFSYVPEETLLKVPEVDFVVSGEGEVTLLELVECIRLNGQFEGIAGITFRKEGKIIRNQPRQLHERIDDLDLLPEEELDIIGNFTFFIPMRHFMHNSIPILAGRGCPNKCIFCVQRTDSYRTRSVGSIMREIDRKFKLTGNKYISFIDPALTLRKRFIYELCQALDDYPVNFKWYCEGRVDTPTETVKRISRSGCISLDFALESGSPRVLKAIRKGIKLDRIKPFAELCHSLGIKTLVFVMVSMPEEREVDAQMTLDILKKISPFVHTYVHAVMQIYIGTELEIRARQKGILPNDFSWFNENFKQPIKEFGPTNIPIYIEHLSPDYIRGWKKEFHKIRDKYAVNFWHEVKKKVGLTLFNWRQEGFKDKISRISRALEIARKKLN